jgi:hypothetical protein
MYKIDSAGAVAGFPAPAALGAVVGWFQPTAGGGTGTIVSADWLNAVQAELIAIPAAAGIALDKTNQGQILAALKVLFGTPHGQCQLQFSSNVALTLAPFNGNLLKVNGKTYALAAGGLAIANAGIHLSGVAASNLAASTVYLLYVMDDGAGNLIPDFWPLAGGHLTDGTAGNIGVEVRSNGGAADSTRTLVGMVMTDAGSNFSDFLTLSWFNRRIKVRRTNFSASRSTSSTSLVELNTEIRNAFLCWASETVDWRMNGGIGGGNSNVYVGASFDGGAAELAVAATAGRIMPAGTSDLKTGLAEGAHYLTALGAVDAGTLTLYAPPAVYSGGTPGYTPFELSVAVRG